MLFRSAAFLGSQLPYLKIAEAIEYVLNLIPGQKAQSLEDILDFDRKARELTSSWIAQH